jgi:hypothetical protein
MKKRKNHSPKSSYVWKEDRTIKKDCCYECGSTEDIHYHHIIPESKGGGMTIPLCIICHGKVHDVDFVKMKKLQKEGIERAKQNGVYGETLEEFLSKPKHAQVVKYINENKFYHHHIAQIVGLSKSTVKKIYKVMTKNELVNLTERNLEVIDIIMQTEYNHYLDISIYEDFEKKYENEYRFWPENMYVDKLLVYVEEFKKSRFNFFKKLPEVEDTLNYVLSNVNPKNKLFNSFDDYISHIAERTVFLHFLSEEPNFLEKIYPDTTKEVLDIFLINALGKKYDEMLEFKNFIIADEVNKLKKIYDGGLPGTIEKTNSELYKYFE